MKDNLDMNESSSENCYFNGYY